MQFDRENKLVVHYELSTKNQAASALLLGYTVIAVDSYSAHHLSVTDPWVQEVLNG